MNRLRLLLATIRFFRACYPRKSRSTVQLTAPQDMPPQDMLNAFAVSDKHFLLSAFHFPLSTLPPCLARSRANSG